MNKNFKKIMIVAVILIATWAIIFRINYVRLTQWKEPILMVKVRSSEYNHNTYFGIGYRIETDYYKKDRKRIIGSYMYLFNTEINGIVDGDVGGYLEEEETKYINEQYNSK